MNTTAFIRIFETNLEAYMQKRLHDKAKVAMIHAYYKACLETDDIQTRSRIAALAMKLLDKDPHCVAVDISRKLTGWRAGL